jgi:hypothetical protein
MTIDHDHTGRKPEKSFPIVLGIVWISAAIALAASIYYTYKTCTAKGESALGHFVELIASWGCLLILGAIGFFWTTVRSIGREDGKNRDNNS